MSDGKRADTYPLQWPLAKRRTPAVERSRAHFGTDERSAAGVRRQQLSVAAALERLGRELTLAGAANVVISTNVRTTLAGTPRSGRPEPEDPGVACYFRLRQRPHVLACDKWDRVADNIAAIGKHVAALRGQERWGVGSLEQAFAGYLALVASMARPWRDVLRFSSAHDAISLDMAEQKYRELARQLHPDAGGSASAMAELNAAIVEARAELRQQQVAKR